MQYYELTKKKHHFIITPDELREVLKDFHHVVVTRGVRKGYVESDPNDFFFTYDALYERLKNGDKLVYEKDYDLVNVSTGITAHLGNCIYEPSSRLSVPKFAEPCPFLDTFCLIPHKDQLSATFWVGQFPQYVCGLCLYFPVKIEYENATEKHEAGIVNQTELDDYATYQLLLDRIKAITKPLKLDFMGKTRRTAVRISEAAKKDFANFYFVTAFNATIL